MAIRQENVVLNNQELIRVSSSNYKKIQYTPDMNIYSVVYVAPGTFNSDDFVETTIPVPQISSGVIVSTKDIVDLETEISTTLSSQILNVIDVSDGLDDDTFVISCGGAL